LAVARRLLRRTSYSLGALAEAYGIPRPTHRAPDDVRALRSVFDAMLPALEARGVTTVEALLRYARGLQPNEPDPEPPALISLALSERRRLRLRYAGTRSPAPTEREVDPLEVTVERGALCLRAFCYLRNDVRTFVITRIVSVELV
jgi:DNA polymerase III subunit epsilon